MGCIPGKNRKQQIPQKQVAEDETDFVIPPRLRKKKQSLKTDLSTTIASTTFKSKKSINRLSSNSTKYSPDRFSLIHGHIQDRSTTRTKIFGPELEKQGIDLNCDEGNKLIYLGLLHGYCVQNVKWVSSMNSYLQNKQCLQESQDQSYFFLQQNSLIFAKLKSQCTNCNFIENITTCKSVFTIVPQPCLCSSKCRKISLVKLIPQFSQVWLEERNEILLINKAVDLLNGKNGHNFQIFGCTSCRKFKKLEKRLSCECATCEECVGQACKLCDS